MEKFSLKYLESLDGIPWWIFQKIADIFFLISLKMEFLEEFSNESSRKFSKKNLLRCFLRNFRKNCWWYSRLDSWINVRKSSLTNSSSNLWENFSNSLLRKFRENSLWNFRWFSERILEKKIPGRTSNWMNDWNNSPVNLIKNPQEFSKKKLKISWKNVDIIPA